VQVQTDGRGLEAAARDARRAALAAALQDGEVLALAHHQDDQAETMLLRALRGSGVDGLLAMQRWSRLATHRVWRPLLQVPQQTLRDYAAAHALRWIDDPSNTLAHFDRNFLRLEVMPLLRTRWPHAAAALSRSASLCGEAAQVLAAHDADSLLECAGSQPGTLSRARLRDYDAPRRARVLRAWIAARGLPPLPAHGVDAIEGQVLDARADASAAFAWHGASVRAWRDLLHAGPESTALDPTWSTNWSGEAPLPLPTGDTLRLLGAPRFDAPLRVHARQGGERLRLPARAHSHTLKHLLQEAGIPPWQRERLPLLSDPDGVLMAAGDRIFSAAFDHWLRVHGARLCWDTGTT